MNVVSLSYFMFVYFLVCLQLHVSNKVGLRRRRSVGQTYANHERQKMLAYGEKGRRVEHGTLTPLVFTCMGGAGPSGSQFIKRLASKISDHRDMPYSQAVGWLRCRVAFALLRSVIICLRGSRWKKSVRRSSLRLLPPMLGLTSWVKWVKLVVYPPPLFEWFN